MFDTFYDRPLQNQPKTVAEEMDVQRQMFGVMLQNAPHTSDIGVNLHERGNSQLLVVLGFSHLDLRVDFASSSQLHLGGGRGGGGMLSQKASPCRRQSCVGTTFSKRFRNVFFSDPPLSWPRAHKD